MSRQKTAWSKLNSHVRTSRHLTISLALLSSLASINHSSFAQSLPPQTRQGAGAQSTQEMGVLEPGKPVERELAGGQSHSYKVPLIEGQFMQVAVKWRGVQTLATLSSPDGRRLAQVVSTADAWRAEPIRLIARASGDYRLEVRLREKGAAGRYEVKIEELRESTPQDRNRLMAEEAYAAGWQLSAQRTAEGRQKAVEKFKEALPLWQAAGDRAGEAKTHHALGNIHGELDERQKALDYFAQALSLRRAVGDRRGEAATLISLGVIYDRLDTQKSLLYYKQALVLYQAVGDRQWEAYSLNNIGYSHNSSGEKQKALDYYHQAIPIFRAVGDRYGEANTLNNSGFIYRDLKENQKAVECFSQARRLYQTIGDRGGEAHSLHSLGDTYVLMGEHQKALEQCSQALSLTRSSGNRREEVSTLSVMGKAYTALHEHQKALEHFGQALQLWRAMGERSGEASTFHHIARVERSRGNLTASRARIEAALNIVESLRNKVVSQELRSSYFAMVQEYFEFYIDLLMQLHQAHPSAGHEAEALQAAERTRARSLLEILAESGADIRQGADPALLERARALQQLLNTKERERMRLLSRKHTEEQATAAEKELDALLTQYQEVQAQIRATSPRYAALTQPQPLSLKEIQQQVLDPDTLLLEYALGSERSFLWAVTPTSISSYELPRRAEIEALARRVYDLLTARNQQVKEETTVQRQTRLAQAEAQYSGTAAALSRVLLGPVAEQLGKKRLLIVADGALQYLPFAALPEPATRGRGEDSAPLAVEHEIVNLPSASTLAVLRRELAGRKAAARAVAVFADPVFEPDDVRVRPKLWLQAGRGKRPPTRDSKGTGKGQTAARPEHSPSPEPSLAVEAIGLERTVREVTEGQTVISRLGYSRQEAGAILAAVPAGEGLKALDFEASRATATGAELGQYRIVHFATHGLLNSEHPELSGIVLSLVDEQGRSQDGFLRLHDVYNLRLSAELVVLSACQTGLGKEIRGEGLVGLTRGFMYAGAARVVASLWKVDDRATAGLMRRFYQGMLGGKRLTPAAALREAQVEMWKQPWGQSPYYWAAFVLQGEWR
jgi:CHAT domain-containing protein/tetratricopeptide (TPR) repeat protein